LRRSETIPGTHRSFIDHAKSPHRSQQNRATRPPVV
jgi:hypothetical protein